VMESSAHFSEARKSFYAALLQAVLRVDDLGIASNADRHNQYSVRIAGGIVSQLGAVRWPSDRGFVELGMDILELLAGRFMATEWDASTLIYFL
jgi:hypothetical protein